MPRRTRLLFDHLAREDEVQRDARVILRHQLPAFVRPDRFCEHYRFHVFWFSRMKTSALVCRKEIEEKYKQGQGCMSTGIGEN